tara:strand:+ start:1547 stop:2620 length:1074 start_codon:yes stop_codon:yes gene_type:complete
MPEDTYYDTYAQDTKDLFWDPFEAHWKSLGFADAQEVYDKYGKLFPGYNEKAEQNLYAQSDAATAGDQAAFDLMISHESERLSTNTENRQFNSELQLSTLERQGRSGEEMAELKKGAVTKQAIDSIDKAKKNISRSGISSGTIQSKLNMATDTVKSKINSANASQAFARRKNKKSIESLKTGLGYMDENNDWVKGSQGQLEQIKAEASTGLAETKLENRSDIRAHETQMQAADMYQAWQRDIYGAVGKLFAQDPTGSMYDECMSANKEWDFDAGRCPGLHPEVQEEAEGVPAEWEDADVVADHDPNYDPGDSAGDTGADEYDPGGYDDWDYGDYDYGDYGDYDYGDEHEYDYGYEGP